LLEPWLLILPLSCCGVLAAHELAYALTRTPRGETHGYLAHLPQLALLLFVLSLVGATLVERGPRIALWPFPAVALSGFVLQEHLERLAHGGAIPFLLDKPFFLVGFGVQALVAERDEHRKERRELLNRIQAPEAASKQAGFELALPDVEDQPYVPWDNDDAFHESRGVEA